jgi:hypothetical protein
VVLAKQVLIATIRKLLVKEVGEDKDPRPWTNFDAMLTSVRNVNDMPGTAKDVQVTDASIVVGSCGSTRCVRERPVVAQALCRGLAERLLLLAHCQGHWSHPDAVRRMA